MRTIWHSLVWKEWHEHKWKLASITAILCGVAATIFCVVESQDTFGLAMVFITMCVIPLSIFVGSAAAAGEQSRRTLPFLQALPAPMWRASLTKLAFGLFTLVIAVLLTIAFTFLAANVARGFGFHYASAIRIFEKDSLTGYWYIDFALICAPIAASFFIWSAAAGVNRRDEISAGAVALAAMVGWSTVLVGIDALLRTGSAEENRSIAIMVSTAPGGFVPATATASQVAPPDYFPLIVVTATIAHLSLATFYVRRFGRTSNREVRSLQTAACNSTRADWLGAPRRSAWSAIVWKQFRESGPIAMAGLAGSIAITAAVLLDNLLRYQTGAVDFPGQVFAKTSVFLGFFVALVAGIGICLNDVTPAVNTFWRSRPIEPDVWFWTKFVTGLLVVLTSIYAPIALLAATHVPVFYSWNFPDAYQIPAMHVAVFAAAAAMTCLVRNAVYAAILAIATVYVATLLGIAISLLPGLLHLVPLNQERWWQPNTPQMVFGLALSFTISTVVAWLATRHDWGRTSRY